MAKDSAGAAYRWDVFISYPRRPGVRRWVAEVFHPQIEEDLQNVGLRRPPKVFLDQEEIEAGDSWPDKLSGEHASSRIVLAVLCFPYFESAWCCSEWRTASLRDKYGAKGPIIPIRFNDLESDTIKSLPPAWRKDVAGRQYHDLQEFTPLVNRLSDTDLAQRFRTRMANFCQGVLKPAILGAPPRSAKWRTMPSDPFIRTKAAFKARLGG